MRLENKVGLVTGAASGMGRAGALRFAREGAAVGIADVDAEGLASLAAEIEAGGGRAAPIAADLARDDDARRIVEETVADLGALDFLWCHLGHPGPGRVERIDMHDFDVAVTLNLRSAIVTTEAAIPHLRASGGGSILYTSSTAGLVGSPNSPVYSAVKSGVNGFMKALALRLAPEGIRVNSICPGPVETPMLSVFYARPDIDADLGANLDARRKLVPLERFARPEEIAAAALFLLSDDASYVTGAAIPVDGGITAR